MLQLERSMHGVNNVTEIELDGGLRWIKLQGSLLSHRRGDNGDQQT
jgi:hypothetical protein